MKIILFVMSLFLLSANAHAFITGIEVPAKKSSAGCYIYQKYIALVIKRSGPIGEIIVVRERASEEDFNCNKASKQSEVFMIDGSDSTETFVGVFMHFLFTDSGTGPDGRAIGIYDLRKRAGVYYATYSGDEMKIENDALIFHKDIEKSNKLVCPDAEKLTSQGLDFGFEQKTRVDLESLREAAIGEITCSSRQ